MKFAAVATVVLAGWCVWASPALGQQADAPSTVGVTITGDYGYGFPPDASEHGHEMDRLIVIVHWFMGVLFVGWGVFFAYCLVRFRRRPGHQAGYDMIKAKPSKYAELGVAVFEGVLLISFSMPAWTKAKSPPDPATAVNIRVVAEQFAWNFHYPGKDGKFGKTDPKHIDTAINAVGVDRSGEGKDDVISGELHVPVGEAVICQISSKDVIHSFGVPVLRVKQDAMPGMRIPVWFKAVKTGTYEVACAQLCGNNHYKMKALIVIEPRDQYDAWLEKKGAPPKEFEEE